MIGLYNQKLVTIFHGKSKYLVISRWKSYTVPDNKIWYQNCLILIISHYNKYCNIIILAYSLFLLYSKRWVEYKYLIHWKDFTKICPVKHTFMMWSYPITFRPAYLSMLLLVNALTIAIAFISSAKAITLLRTYKYTRIL